MQDFHYLGSYIAGKEANNALRRQQVCQKMKHVFEAEKYETMTR